MQYMQWSYSEMLHCSDDYVEIIAEMSQQEAAEARAASRNR